MKLIELPSKGEPNRQDKLRGFLALNRIRITALAAHMGVTAQAVGMYFHSKTAPKHRIEQLVELGIPRELLPPPCTNRQGVRLKKDTNSGQPDPT